MIAVIRCALGRADQVDVATNLRPGIHPRSRDRPAVTDLSGVSSASELAAPIPGVQRPKDTQRRSGAIQ